MANEAIVVENPKNILDFTVAEGATIEQFTLCKLSSARTAAASSSADVFAGISMTEKETGDGQVNLGLAHDDGVFVLKNSGTQITAGAIVSLSGTNLIKSATEAEIITGAGFGKALETISGSGSGEVRLGL